MNILKTMKNKLLNQVNPNNLECGQSSVGQFKVLKHSQNEDFMQNKSS